MDGDSIKIMCQVRSGQLRSRSGLVQVWFSLELKFNSLELDSEVGQLVSSAVIVPPTTRNVDIFLQKSIKN